MTPSRMQRSTLGGRAAEARVARFVVPATLVLGIVLAYAAHQLATAIGVGAGFTAKVVCSLHFNSGLEPDDLMRGYVDAELGGFGPVMRLEVDDASVTARGPFGVSARAVYRPGHGCTLLAGRPESAIAPATDYERFPVDILTHYYGADPKSGPAGVEAAIDAAFAEPAEAGRERHTTAVVVLHQGKLIAERYAAGYGRDVPMLSWSMAKSVLAALVGALVQDGRLDLHAPAPVSEWATPGDPRGAITLDMLLRQSSGLAFDETYGALNDVSRMLFTAPDTGAFAARQPLQHPPDSVWSYSSGTSNIVARIAADELQRSPDVLAAFAREELFEPCQIRSAFFEPDASGTPIGSSFAFMTALDWARFGELHRNDGVCGKQRVLPGGWVDYVTTPTPAAPQGRYGAHWWLNAGSADDAGDRPWPELPADMYAAMGHSGQWVVVVPSAELVVVRLGLSQPDDANDGTVELVAALIDELGGRP